jgi:hypothetical protein
VLSCRCGVRSQQNAVACALRSHAWWRCSTAPSPSSSRPTPHWVQRCFPVLHNPQSGALQSTARASSVLQTRAQSDAPDGKQHVPAECCAYCRRSRHGVRRLPGSRLDRRRAGGCRGEGSGVIVRQGQSRACKDNSAVKTVGGLSNGPTSHSVRDKVPEHVTCCAAANMALAHTQPAASAAAMTARPPEELAAQP